MINFIPSIVNTETLHRYRSIEEVRHGINVDHIYVPSYFPQGIDWPPSEILAQGKPFKEVVLKFKHGGSGEVAMIIYQVELSRDFTEEREIRIKRVMESVKYSLKGKEADLLVGTCEDNEACSKISWIENGFRVIILMKSTPLELIKIADSIRQ